MCAVIHRAKSYQLALLIKKSLDDVRVPVKPLYNTSIEIFISPYALFAEGSMYRIVTEGEVTMANSTRGR